MALTMSEVQQAPGTSAEPASLRLLTSPERRPSGAARRPATGRLPGPTAGRTVLILLAVGMVTLLALPLAALGGHRGAGSRGVGAPAGALPAEVRGGAGTFYVVRAGDTLASIAARLDPRHVRATESRLASELGSSVVVPGEHVTLG